MPSGLAVSFISSSFFQLHLRLSLAVSSSFSQLRLMLSGLAVSSIIATSLLDYPRSAISPYAMLFIVPSALPSSSYIFDSPPIHCKQSSQTLQTILQHFGNNPPEPTAPHNLKPPGRPSQTTLTSLSNLSDDPLRPLRQPSQTSPTILPSLADTPLRPP
ncbi:hypothetical protein P692DRAFT_20877753 [Suillus brevipes Sb2]|nr:hypothetical protein P692DRAFT_20877753 [Suillus brevipes Sb2]